MTKLTQLLVSIIALIITLGCGGGGGGGTVSTGNVSVTINWPGRSRYVPPYANSVVCEIKINTSRTLSLTINRTGDSEYQGTGTFAQGVPEGVRTMTLKAYTGANGQGSAVADASLSVAVTAGQSVTVDVTADIQTTIDHLVMDGTPLAVRTGNTLQVSAHAVSSTSQVILLPSGSLTWDITSGGSCGSVDPTTGLFTATAVGTATLRAQEAGAQKSVTANVIVSNPTAGAELVVSVEWPGRSRYVPPYANSLVCTLKISDSESYSITINRSGSDATSGVGQFTQSLPAGTYTLSLAARSLTNGAGTLVATATTQVVLVVGQITTRNVTADLQSTINKVVIDGQPISVQAPNILQIAGHAEDASGNTILLPSGALTWDVTAGSQYGTINATTGAFTSISAGTTTIRLREVGAAKSATATVTIASSVVPQKVYVGDSSNSRIVRMSDMTGTGWLALSPGSSSVGGIAFDSQNRIYWTDDLLDMVYRADDMLGTNLVSYGSSGVGAGQFSGPKGIAIDSSDRIYIADRFNNRIVRINDMTGDGWTTLGSFGSNDGEFYIPEGVYVTTDGVMTVADTGNCRIVQTNGMTTTGWTSYGDTRGSDYGQFDNPTSVYVTSAGVIYVADSFNNRIVKMNGISGSGWTALGGTSSGSGQNQFDFPTAIAVDASGKIYIADSNNNRVVRVNSITGLSWVVLGTLGTGTNQFSSPSAITVH
jgi:ribosomal protein S11